MVTPRHKLQSKRHKKIHDYSQKSINDFKLFLVKPSPNLYDQEKKHVRNSFDASSQDQYIDLENKNQKNS